VWCSLKYILKKIISNNVRFEKGIYIQLHTKTWNINDPIYWSEIIQLQVKNMFKSIQIVNNTIIQKCILSFINSQNES
jgi:hypothetical protein